MHGDEIKNVEQLSGKMNSVTCASSWDYIPEYTLEFTYFLIKGTIFVKNNRPFALIWGYVYFVRPLEYLFKKHPVPTKRAILILIVKSCNALLRMLPVCIGICLKSILKYKLLILDSCQPDIIITLARTRGPVVIFRSQKGYTNKKVWKTLLYWGLLPP
jgi:hypothetical protein